MDFFQCRTLAEAQEIIQQALEGLTPPLETVKLSAALGRIVASDIASAEDLPPFSRSTVDGYAVHSADTFGAGEGIPATLEIAGEVFMGKKADTYFALGQAIAIPTGGMLPSGADAVIMLEHTERVDGETLLVLRAVAPGENTIAKGEDIRSGQLLAAQGQRLSPAHIGALAACGYPEVTVFKQLQVGILSTGDEIVDIDMEPVGEGQIRDINSYALAAVVAEQGHRARSYGIVPDDYETLYDRLRQAAAECQLVIVSGGSSVGVRDHTVRAIEALSGQEVLFHGLSVKPGKPTIFGLIGRTPVFGLPGHPVSALTIYDQVVKPAADYLAGAVSHQAKIIVPARISRNVPSAPGRDDIIRVQLTKAEHGYQAEPVFGKSGLISTLVKSDGLIRIAAGSSGLYAGDMVAVELLHRWR